MVWIWELSQAQVLSKLLLYHFSLIEVLKMALIPRVNPIVDINIKRIDEKYDAILYISQQIYNLWDDHWCIERRCILANFAIRYYMEASHNDAAEIEFEVRVTLQIWYFGYPNTNLILAPGRWKAINTRQVLVPQYKTHSWYECNWKARRICLLCTMHIHVFSMFSAWHRQLE